MRLCTKLYRIRQDLSEILQVIMIARLRGLKALEHNGRQFYYIRVDRNGENMEQLASRTQSFIGIMWKN